MRDFDKEPSMTEVILCALVWIAAAISGAGAVFCFLKMLWDCAHK